ncbi:MAG: SGNH/GDSL hydrolase family protein [Pseudomonadota bacterium]
MKQLAIRKLLSATTAAVCAMLVGACGGGGSNDRPRNDPPPPPKPVLKIFGDSLMDSGTFGFKVTVQNADKNKPFEIFPEKIASSLGANTPCPHFNFAVTGYVSNLTCTNYAVGGGRINTRGDTKAVVDTTTPLSILNQISAGATLLASSDIVVIDGGANDMADLVGAYLAINTPDGLESFTNKLSTVLPAATVAALVTATPTAMTLNAAALAYAQGLAQLMAQTINDKILARGVRKVVVINAVDISATPIFGGVMAAAGAAQGSAQRNAVQASIQTWTNAYNSTLASRLTSNSVLVVDLNSQFTQFLTRPAQYGLTNTTTPACPRVPGGLDAYGLASLSQLPTVLACNSSNLSDHIPAGETASTWWQSYAFADDLHPTPALHALIGTFVLQQMVRVGWIAAN